MKRLNVDSVVRIWRSMKVMMVLVKKIVVKAERRSGAERRVGCKIRNLESSYLPSRMRLYPPVSADQ